AAFLCAFLLSWVLFLQSPHVLAAEPVAWLAPGETLAVSGGAWTFYWLGASDSASRTNAIHAGCSLFGVTLLIFGLSHFLYIKFPAGMIPAWTPWHVPWAWITGIGHIAAGLSIITGVQARLGSRMLALMMSGFVLLVHIPRIAAAVDNSAEWHLGSTALLLTGAAWITASALASRQHVGEADLERPAPPSMNMELGDRGVAEIEHPGAANYVLEQDHPSGNSGAPSGMWPLSGLLGFPTGPFRELQLPSASCRTAP